MPSVFVNLKRFDVPRERGGICPFADPQQWIRTIMEDTVRSCLGREAGLRLAYLLPEALIVSARQALSEHPETQRKAIAIGCQGVYRENVEPGGNFGAFTSNLPAVAARNLGCTWAMVGHSEERRDKLGIIEAYDPASARDEAPRNKASMTVNRLINREVLCALDSGLRVLLCIGETEEQRGGGSFEEQKPRIREILRTQLQAGLAGVTEKEAFDTIQIGYEPIWAIGPGKTPPGKAYIEFVSASIKEAVQESFGIDPVVVYGGGLKEDNAGMIASISTIGGGLVALTRFTDPIAFEVEGLQRIVEEYARHERKG